MNEGVRLLLERIKTHPEEFMKGGRWIDLLAEYNDYIPEELKPITEEVRALVKDEFTRDVMKELLDSEKETEPDAFEEALRRSRQNQLLSAHRTKFGKLKYDSIEES